MRGTLFDNSPNQTATITMESEVSLGRGDWAYIAVAVTWSVILFSAMGFLWHHRRLPQLQMRRLPLVFVAMISLHIYWTIVLIAYVLGPAYPCVVEYWVMSILLPFGIAMFQLANTQFLWIAAQQRRYMSIDSLDDLKLERKSTVLDGSSGSLWQRTKKRLTDANRITRMVVYVILGIVMQVVLTIIIYLLSRKFHGHFGLIPANLFSTDVEQRHQCIRGWEWWLSIVWQFFWAWIYAPVILWQSRRIQDTHGWRLQTILCCIAGLPCSPLWLCGLYSSNFAKINEVFIPPMWFAVSIFFLQVFTILLPCYQVYHQHHLRTETLAIIAEWEIKTKGLSSNSMESGSTMIGSTVGVPRKANDASEKDLTQALPVNEEDCIESTERDSMHAEAKDRPRAKSKDAIEDPEALALRRSQMYTMDGLEHALATDAEPLQRFAALRDFSGENISFLTHLRTWKKIWASREREKENPEFSDARDQERVDEVRLRDHFNRAINLYTTFISTDFAVFPVDISPSTLKKLDAIFSAPTKSLFGESLTKRSTNSTMQELERRNPPLTTEIRETVRSNSEAASVMNFEDVWYWDDIPAKYSAKCFDDAEGEIKFLVLTNTWPKFLNAGHDEEVRDAEGEMIAQRLTQFFARK